MLKLTGLLALAAGATLALPASAHAAYLTMEHRTPATRPPHVVNSRVGVDGGTLALGVGSDPSARRTALLHVCVNQGGLVSTCRFQVQGTLWTSP